MSSGSGRTSRWQPGSQSGLAAISHGCASSPARRAAHHLLRLGQGRLDPSRSSGA